jgi:hypothetical protein
LPLLGKLTHKAFFSFFAHRTLKNSVAKEFSSEKTELQTHLLGIFETLRVMVHDTAVFHSWLFPKSIAVILSVPIIHRDVSKDEALYKP